MMYTRLAMLLMCGGVLVACDQTTNIATNAHQQENTDVPLKTNPDINIKVDLPIYLQGIPSLLHPVTVSAVDEYAQKSFSGEKISSFVDVSHDTLSGQMFNVVFEELQTGQTQPLFATNHQLIYQAQYLMWAFDNPEQEDKKEPIIKHYHHFIYKVQEKINQENKEEKLSLYISDDRGNQLKKLHPDDEYVIQTQWVAQAGRYYFITKSDSDNDGKITLKDKSHNYYVDFQDIKNPTIKPYDFMPK